MAEAAATSTEQQQNTGPSLNICNVVSTAHTGFQLDLDEVCQGMLPMKFGFTKAGTKVRQERKLGVSLGRPAAATQR